MLENTDRRQIKNRHYKTKHNPEKSNNTKHSKTKLQSPFTTLCQETRWAYSTMLPSQHWAH